MQRIILMLTLLMTMCGSLFAWTSETGSGVVSDNAAIVRASLEATQVLISDTSSNLYGTTILGGTTNYSSFNSGGILSLRNTVSSRDVVQMGSDDFIQYMNSRSAYIRTGLSADDVYVIQTDTSISGRVSADNLVVASAFATSINTTRIYISGATTITSTFTTGTCSFEFDSGLLTTATC